MAKRQNSMATIDEALQNQTVVVNEEPIAPPPDASEPHAAPGVNAPTPVTDQVEKLTPEEKRRNAEIEKETKKRLAEEEKSKSERQKLIDEAIKERERQQQEQADAFKSSANTVVDKTSQVWRGATVGLGRIPTPGSILLPLVALLVFFFLLLPVNGHTRFVWLWLVLTGNASIGDTGGNAQAGEASAPTGPNQGTTGTNLGTPNPNTTQTQPGLFTLPAQTNGYLSNFPQAQVTPVTPTFFTGPEDVVR